MTKVEVVLPLELKSDNSYEETSNSNASELVSSEESSFCERLNKSNLSSELDSPDDSPESNRIAKMKNKSNRCLFEPYPELSLREKQRLEEKRSRRAILVHEEIFRYGLTFGPYSSTQLQVGDHDVTGLKFGQMTCSHRYRSNSSSQGSSEEDDVGTMDNSYDAMYVQYLNRKSNQDLVVDYMNLEDRLEDMDKTLRETRFQNRFKIKTKDFNADSEMEKIRVFEVEIDKLSEENELLRTENEHLLSLLSSVTE